MLLRLALAMALLTGSARAESLPARYDIVAPRPVMLRHSPDPGGAPTGQSVQGPAAVEVTALSVDRNWARINLGDGAAWMPKGALRRWPAPRDEGLPMRCYGTAPFWGLHLASAFFAEIEAPEHPDLPLQITGAARAEGALPRTRLWTLSGAGLRATLTVRDETCTDGISDRIFGFSATLARMENTGAVALRLGCCSLTGP